MKKNYFIPIFIIIAIIGVGWYYTQKAPPSAEQAQERRIIELKNGDSYTLTAGFVTKNIDGKTYKMLAYNGTIPGPTIKVAQGAEVTINLKNNLDTPTTLHSHGVRMDNLFDGVPDVTQKKILPGETFVYKLKFPDAGVYWYHPHLDEASGQALGLYGNFLVTPNDPAYWSPVNKEVSVILSDLLTQDGNIVPFSSPVNHALMGRYGNVLLVNGATDYKLSLKQGEVIRFYLTNAANTRTYNFAIKGAKIKLVGADNGKYESEAWVDSVVLSPSERTIVEVLFEKPGVYTLEHKTPLRTYVLGSVEVVSEKVANSYVADFQTLRTNKDVTKSIDPFRASFKKPADKKLALTVDMGSMGSMTGGNMMPGGTMMRGTTIGADDKEKIEWEDSAAMMNQNSTADMVKWKIKDLDTGKTGMDINWKFKVGDKVKVSIFNDPKSAHPMQHPIHFHGQRFLVLSTNGVTNDNLVWKDTTLVQKGDTVEILVEMSNPGKWMAHCHIPEHLESGMMMNFEVLPKI